METPDLSLFRLLEDNPRTITDVELERLEESMQKFGEISGIIRNTREGVETANAIFGGNQRMKIILRHPEKTGIQYTAHYDPPTEHGTVAEGYVLYDGQRFNYREVDWSDEWVREACIKANLLGGHFEMHQVLQWYDRCTLMDWGFVETEFPPVEPIVYDDDDMADVADDVGSSTSVRYMVVGSYRVPLTDEEFARLTGRIAAWAEKRGTLYGIVNDLLGGRDGNVR